MFRKLDFGHFHASLHPIKTTTKHWDADTQGYFTRMLTGQKEGKKEIFRDPRRKEKEKKECNNFRIYLK